MGNYLGNYVYEPIFPTLVISCSYRQMEGIVLRKDPQRFPVFTFYTFQATEFLWANVHDLLHLILTISCLCIFG